MAVIDLIAVDPEEYEELKDDSLFLLALQDAGVDNWSGYEFAQERYEELKKEQSK